jgi:hypothetical protein
VFAGEVLTAFDAENKGLGFAAHGCPPALTSRRRRST